MGDAGVDENGVYGLVGAKGKAVGGHHSRLWPSVGKVGARPLREAGLNLDRGHLAARSDDLSENGAVIAHAGADMDHTIARLEAELVEEPAHRLGCPLLSRRVSSMATSTSWQRRRGSASSVVQ